VLAERAHQGRHAAEPARRRCARASTRPPSSCACSRTRAFFRGETGSFGLIVLDAEAGQSPTAIGTLERDNPLQVLGLASVNTAHFPLIGYFRPPFRD
jgi:hypothetical protein